MSKIIIEETKNSYVPNQSKFQRLYNYFVYYNQNENRNDINEHRTNDIIDEKFCEDCSVIYNTNLICLKHCKYNYKMEISPCEIGHTMFDNIIDNFKNENYKNIDKIYLEHRSNLFSLLEKISKNMNFKSQTLFHSFYLLDVIYSNKDSIQLIKNKHANHHKLALACLLISSKIYEIDSFFPSLNVFIKSFDSSIHYNQLLTKEELLHYEVLAIQLLNYNIHYFSIYDFISFFFCHGIIQKEQINYIYDNQQITKILEKIYFKARYYLNEFIKSEISIKFNSLILAIYILEQSINDILKNQNNKNYLSEIMEKVYKISYLNDNEYLELLNYINENKHLQSFNKINLNTQLNYIQNPKRKLYSEEYIDSILHKYRRHLNKNLYLTSSTNFSSSNLSNLNYSQKNISINSSSYDNNDNIHNHIKSYNSFIPNQKHNYSNLLRYSLTNNNVSQGDLQLKIQNINNYNRIYSFYKNNVDTFNQNINSKIENIDKAFRRNYLNQKYYFLN